MPVEEKKQDAPVSTRVAIGGFVNEIPRATLDQLTAMAKYKFADQVLAGHDTDKAVCQFRTDWLVDAVKAAYTQFDKGTKARAEKRSRDLYTALRERGMSIEEAVKQSGYNPLV